ncbi:hypothetical protein [Halogeometricum limi]|uniref:Uncharacterized protein n=1 Tax=Halogeometricum limi TaxID=555875 RepID=A0A1I6IRT1_9EURY|nr:hypothetical protein [Halogeometricum limi]SFR69443.1 hypothetical protein SAMN04488124_3593 [Halogeometricum limi]
MVRALHAGPRRLGRLLSALAVLSAAAAAWTGRTALVYWGAFARELFGPCARETLDCAVATANWVAVFVTVVGLGAMALGGWTVWRLVRVVRVLSSASRRAE